MMDFFNPSDETIKILPTALAVIISSVIVYISLVITEWFQNKVSKKRRGRYFKFLRGFNKIIDECILDFEKSSEGKHSQKWQIISLLLGLILGFVLTFLIFMVCYNVLKMDVWRSMAYPALVNFIPYILTIKLMGLIKREEKTLLDENNRIKYYFNAIRLFIICSNILILFFIFMNLSFINYSITPVSPSEIEKIRNTYAISLSIIAVTIYFFNTSHKEFLDKMKSQLNKKYFNEFPFIHITTQGYEVTGKIQDVFDGDLVILDDNGFKTVVEWNTIITLGLKK